MSESNFLNGTKCYLSGPIQYAVNDFWREGVINNLQNKFGIDIFDPFADEKNKWTNEILEAKTISDTFTLEKIAKKFVRKDLGMVDKSDFLIAYLPTGVQTVGTVHEIINSNNNKKPTLLVTDKEEISHIPLWYFGFIKREYMFAGFENLYKYLEKVNDGACAEDDRWHLVYKII